MFGCVDFWIIGCVQHDRPDPQNRVLVVVSTASPAPFQPGVSRYIRVGAGPVSGPAQIPRQAMHGMRSRAEARRVAECRPYQAEENAPASRVKRFQLPDFVLRL
jgi:hypothetical protein